MQYDHRHARIALRMPCKASSQHALSGAALCQLPTATAALQVSMQDFHTALAEVKPAFGAVVDTLESYRLNGIIDWGEGFRHLSATCRTLVEQV